MPTDNITHSAMGSNRLLSLSSLPVADQRVVLASRLSEDPSCSVLLLEAGKAYTPDGYPETLTDINGNTVEPKYIWGYKGAAGQPPHDVLAFAGRLRGGSSAINGAISRRAGPSDFARWREHGLPDWSFEEALEPPKPPVIRYERDHPGELLHLELQEAGPLRPPRVPAPPAIAPSAIQVLASKVSTSPSTTIPASPSPVSCPMKKCPALSTLSIKPSASTGSMASQIQRLLTDRGSTHRSRLFAASCHARGLKHSFTKPYRPQTNDKAERFIQTITREWAYARRYKSSNHRATFLPHYLHDYNFHRPHSALN